MTYAEAPNVEVRPLGLRRSDRTHKVLRLPLRAVPVYPADADNLSAVRSWNGSTNIRYGTCGPVTCANSVIATWRYLLGQDITVTDEAVFDLYRRSGNPGFDPATGAGDDGVEMITMLDALNHGGLRITHGDGTEELVKPVCYAELAYENLDGLKSGTAMAGGLALAWNLDQAQQDQPVWDYVPGSAPWGGHAVYGGAYTGAAADDYALISWQDRFGTTDQFVRHQLGGAFVIVWRPLWDHPAFETAVDKAALAAGYTQLTGRVIPVPDPPPPLPVPGPVPDDAVTAFIADRRVQRWAGSRHVGEGRYVAAQIRALTGAEGQ